MYSQSIKSEWNDRQSKAKHGIPWMLKKSCFGFHWHYVQLNSGSVSVQDNYTDSDVCRFVWCCSRIQISLAAIETSKWSEFLTHTHTLCVTYVHNNAKSYNHIFYRDEWLLGTFRNWKVYINERVSVKYQPHGMSVRLFCLSLYYAVWTYKFCFFL